MYGKNFAQLLRKLVLNQRIEEAAVKEQIRIPGGFLSSALSLRDRRGQVQHHADLTLKRQLAERAHRLRVGQHDVKRHLRRQPAVLLHG